MKQYSIVILGAGGVGKSALTVRFIKDVFVEHYDPTIEGMFGPSPIAFMLCTYGYVAEEYRRTITVDGQLSSLEVLDTAGAEQFTSLNEVYIKSGRGFVLVFRQVLLGIAMLCLKTIYRIKGDSEVPIVVVGTKLDLVSEREVQRSTISTLAARWSLPFYETSAKKNWHITEVFEDLVKQMRDKLPPDEVKRLRKKRTCIIM
ncbi:hypothetical protein H0H93_010470 [Arthromyces matolae]|nr:hypothetical protein H0H93_010470 [Arthromyces matolae]